MDTLKKTFYLLILVFLICNKPLIAQFTEQTNIGLTGVRYSSTAWGDYDNDGDLDILLIGNNLGDLISKIYSNNSDNTFTEQTGISFIGINKGSVAWGDYDNDGDLDILLSGEAKSSIVSKVYRNNGNNNFTEQTDISLTDVQGSSLAWGDYDNDGDLDILLSGALSSGQILKIYRNNGDNTFTEQTGISLTGVSSSSASWGDYDNDGYLDILITGITTDAEKISKIYRNNGDNTFTEQTGISLTGVFLSSASWGDYDNDGDLDILLTGQNNDAENISKIYHNNGDNTFTEQTNISLTGVSNSSVSWGDYNNDGNLDILLTGTTGSEYISKIYSNGNTTIPENSIAAQKTQTNRVSKKTTLSNKQINATNTPPEKTQIASSEVLGNTVTLKWHPATDDHTPSKGLSYNVRVGTTPGSNDIVSSCSDTSGYFRLAQMGNAQLDTFFILRGLAEGTYYWSVQAIDNCFKGGAFSNEGTFTISATNVENIRAADNQIIMYPNPATDYILIEGLNTKSEITIRNISGASISSFEYEENQTKINISDLTKGIYLIEIKENSINNRIFKIIKN
ncbi:FG-GAP-like repeat-containing protein [Saccharicrinis sp. FJH2]|uniref:FG-GAP-like repeat-containing protein n=1 Tax=Saccharicrinis sp. FJH65 TaxID=3344659 RepID=UPI0035F33E23